MQHVCTRDHILLILTHGLISWLSWPECKTKNETLLLFIFAFQHSETRLKFEGRMVAVNCSKFLPQKDHLLLLSAVGFFNLFLLFVSVYFSNVGDYRGKELGRKKTIKNGSKH